MNRSEVPKPRPRSVLGRSARVQTGFVEVDGLRLRVGIRPGHGRPLLLFNGIGANLDMTLPLIEALDDIELIVFDMPGTGESQPLNWPRRYGGLARLSARLLDVLGYTETINVAGVSWGGALAQQFALKYPQRTNRLILAATSTGVVSLPARTGLLRRLSAARGAGKLKISAHRVPRLYGGLARRRPELAERHSKLSGAASRRGYVYQLLAGFGWTSVHRLHGLRCPTLIMGGDDDPIMPLVNTRILYWLIPKSYLHVVRGGGHLFLLLRANECAAVIKRFISERRYDGTDEQDYFTARNLPADGRLYPLTASEAAAAEA